MKVDLTQEESQLIMFYICTCPLRDSKLIELSASIARKIKFKKKDKGE